MSVRTTVVLRALAGRPLADAKLRGVVTGTANALAERTGVVIESMEAGDRELRVTLTAGQIAAIGFAAELRTLTNAWYERKYEVGPLWGTTGEG